MQNVDQNDDSVFSKDTKPTEKDQCNLTSFLAIENEDEEQVLRAKFRSIPRERSLSQSSDEDEASEVESFMFDQEGEEEGDTSQFLLTPETIDGADVRTVDPETQARLEALLEAAGIGKLPAGDGKMLADPEVLRRLTSSVSCALDEAAAALTRMRAEQQGDLSGGEGARSLAKACSSGDIGAVRQLLDEGRSVHETTEEGESLLSLACSAGYYELAQVLLAMRANVEDRGIKGDCTPLMEAASGGYVDIVKLLITHEADVNAQSSAGNTPLHYAACGGHITVVNELIKAGANVEEHNENGHTPLMEAASAGHVPVAKLLLEAGAGINTHSNEFKESALTLACYKGHLKMVEFLLKAGADQEHKTDEMHTALMEASMDGHVEVARLLLDSGAQVNMPADSFESPLTLAACGGHVELASLLIERGANLEEVNDEGYTPLMEAAREGHEEMVALLLAHGAEINAQTEETQETALTLACCGGFLEVADFLIKAGADLELGCSTPLMEAAQEGHLELVKYLIEKDAKVHAKTQTGDTALTYACENGHTAVAEVLLDNSAELEHESEGGRTPLMKAARAGHHSTVQFLIERGADVNRQTSTNDHTVLSLASAGGHLTVVELLLRSSSDPTHRLKDGSTILIEASKGGHTTVVNLLLDWPNNILSSSPDLSQLSPPHATIDVGELPRVPTDGLSNIVPPQDPNHVSIKELYTTKENYTAIQTGGNAPQAPGQINLKHLNIPPRSAEPGKRTAQELSKDKMQLLGQIGEGDAALGNAYISGDNILTDVDMDFVYDKGYAEGDTPMPLEVAEGSEVKACEKFEAIINKMRQKAELLNNTREEQIHKKQQILEELQKVEQELQEKDKAQLLLYAQARLEQERQKQLQQLQKKKEEVEANARNTVPSLQEQSAAVANSQTTALHVAVDHSGLLTCQVEEGIENSIATDIEQDLHALSDCGDDNQLIKKPKLAKQESLGSSASMGSSADSICSHNDSKETSKTDQLSPECTDLSLQPREAKRVKHASDGYEGGGVQGDKQDPDKDVSSDNSSRASSEEIDLSCVLPACTTSLAMSATATALTSEYPTTLDPLIQEQLARQLQQLTLDVATQPQVKNAASLVSKDIRKMKSQATCSQHTQTAVVTTESQELQIPLPQDPLQSIQLSQVLEPLDPENATIIANTIKYGSIEQELQQRQLQAQIALQQQQLKVQAQLQLKQLQAQPSPNKVVPLKTTQPANNDPLQVQLQQQLNTQEAHQLKLQQVQQHLQQLHQQLQQVQQLQTSQQLTQQELLQQAQQLQQQLQQAQLQQLVHQQQHHPQPQQQVKSAVLNSGISVVQNSTVGQNGATPLLLTQQELLQQAQQLQQQLHQAQQLTQIAQQQKHQLVKLKNGEPTATSTSTSPTPSTAVVATDMTATANAVAAVQKKKKKLLPLQQLQFQHTCTQLSLTQQQTTTAITTTTTTTTVQNSGPTIYDNAADLGTPPLSTPATPNPSPASPQISPPIYPSVDLDAQTESNHDTALTLACAGGHAELVSLLLSREADIEHRDKKGFTPLILAATAGHADVVENLLLHGADIEAQSERTKDTPLSLACSGGRYEVVELLLARGANKEHRNVSDYTPLSLAASGGYVNIIKLLLSHGAEINSRTGSKLGISPLMLAAMNGHTAAVKLLLDMGSDINAQIETNRNTALTLACFQGRHEVVSLLVDRKANIEHRAKTGLTPLMEAASGGYVEVGRVLLDKGADVNAPPVPSSRDTALTIAADKGHFRFVELLILREAAIDVKNKKGNSPLWLACNGGHLDVVQLLVNAGADVDSQDNRKVSCLMSSFRKGHVKVVKWLVKHVTQFPSDQECMRFIATVTDKELLKKCHQCMEIIVSAKDRQAAEANKYASILLEELDLEKSREERKKVSIAKKREKRKKKKKEKQEREREQKEKGTSSKTSSPDPDDQDDDDDDDEQISDDVVQQPQPPIHQPPRKTTPPPASARVELLPKTSGVSQPPSVPQVTLTAKTTAAAGLDLPVPLATTSCKKVKSIESNNNDSKPRGKRNRKEKLTSKEKIEEKFTSASLEVKPVCKAPSTLISNLELKTIGKGQEKSKNIGSRKDDQAVVEMSDFVPVPLNNKLAQAKDVLYTDKNISRNTIEEINAATVVGSKAGLLGSKLSNSPSPKKGHKKDDGWKEVTRKSKKVPMPSNCRTKKITVLSTVISRVIGRGGCNLNAIREISGAQIDVDKAKGAADRTITIKGSADAIRQANQLIQALVKDPEHELEHLPKQLKNKLQLTTNTDTFTSNMWHNSMAYNITSASAVPNTVAALTATTATQKIQVAKPIQAVSRSNNASTEAVLMTTAVVSTSIRHSTINSNKLTTTATTSAFPPMGVWGMPQKTVAIATVAPTPSVSSKSSSGVARQLFPIDKKSTPQTSGMKPIVAYSSPANSKTKVVQSSASISTPATSEMPAGPRPSSLPHPTKPVPSSRIQPTPITTGNVQPLKSEPQPLPIKTPAGQLCQNSSKINQNNQGRISPSTAPSEYSPFNNLFSQVSEQVLGKKDDVDNKMNFASVAAAGVLPVQPTTSVSSPIVQSQGVVDPSLEAKAPGYKAPGQRTSSPHMLESDVSKAPGYRPSASQEGIYSPIINEQEAAAARAPGYNRGPVQIPAYQALAMQIEEMRAAELQNAFNNGQINHQVLQAAAIQARLAATLQQPSGIGPISLQMANQNDFGPNQIRNPDLSPPLHRDEYSMPNQPMTLPKIESNLNPNAPNFMTREMQLLQHDPFVIPAMYQGGRAFPAPPQPNNFGQPQHGPIGPSNVGRTPPPVGQEFSSGNTNPAALQEMANASGLLGIQNSNQQVNLGVQARTQRQFSPMGVTAPRPSSASSLGTSSRGDNDAGSPAPGLSSEVSPMSSSAPSPTENNRSAVGMPRPIGNERLGKKAMSNSTEYIPPAMWSAATDPSSDWLSNMAAAAVASGSVMSSSAVLAPADGEVPRPASLPQPLPPVIGQQLIAAGAYPLESVVVDPNLEQVLQVRAAMVVPDSGAVFANGVPAGAPLTVPAVFPQPQQSQMQNSAQPGQSATACPQPQVQTDMPLWANPLLKASQQQEQSPQSDPKIWNSWSYSPGV